AGRCADRLLIEGNCEATGRFDHAGIGVKALPARPARRAPHRLLRIKRRFSGHFIEQFTHYVLGFRCQRAFSRNRLRGMGVNKAEGAVLKVFGAVLVLLAGLGVSTVEAGFRSPESLVRNVYAYYGERSSDLSSGTPRASPTARQFFYP